MRSRKRAPTAIFRENAEYHAAKERQGQIEAMIADIDGPAVAARWSSTRPRLSGDKVVFGATVTLIDEDDKTSATSSSARPRPTPASGESATTRRSAAR